MRFKAIIAAWSLVLMTATTSFANVFGPDGAPPKAQVQEIPQEEPKELSITDKLGPSFGTFKLTSYCTGHCCNGKWSNVTVLGSPIIPGQTIAVDKRIIPIGTWVYINIPGQGWQKFRAEDVGGGVRGHHIDIAVQHHYETFNPAYNGYAEVRIALA